MLARYALEGEVSPWKLEKEYTAKPQLFRIQVCDPESHQFPVIQSVNEPNWVDVDELLKERAKDEEEEDE